MKRWLAAAALLVAASCSAPPPPAPEPEPVPRQHLAPPSRPYLETAPAAFINAFEWEIDRRNWTGAVLQLERTLEAHPQGLVRFPFDSRRWIPAWRFFIERSGELPSDFIAAYRALLDEKFLKAKRRYADRIATLRRYFLCTDADLLADALANEALEDGDRWQAAGLWHLVQNHYPGSTLPQEVLSLRRQWALGMQVRSIPGIQVGDAHQPHAIPVIQATPPDNAPPTPMDKATDEDDPGFEHTHVVTEELLLRFTRDGPAEPLHLSVVHGESSFPLCRWYKERAPGSPDPDKFLTDYRACNPAVLLCADRAWIISGFGFIAGFNTRYPEIDWVLEYPRNGVWREKGTGRLERAILGVLAPDSNVPWAVDVIDARWIPLEPVPEDVAHIEAIDDASITVRAAGRLHRVRFVRR